VLHCRKFCKCYDVPTPRTTVKKKEKKPFKKIKQIDNNEKAELNARNTETTYKMLIKIRFSFLQHNLQLFYINWIFGFCIYSVLLFYILDYGVFNVLFIKIHGIRAVKIKWVRQSPLSLGVKWRVNQNSVIRKITFFIQYVERINLIKHIMLL
jgi:hypothetical protein